VSFPALSDANLHRLDKTSSNEFLGSLYRCANVYVAPYQSEGFNLPVLESMASGTPVIVPRGGCTDDFTRSKFTRYIKAVVSETADPTTDKIMNRMLRVDKDSLFSEMKFVLDDHATAMKWLKTASKAAANFAREHYEWKSVLKLLIEHLASDKKSCFSKILSKDEL
jgi:glycosyltransferase involved in cell wall biosynthesis